MNIISQYCMRSGGGQKFRSTQPGKHIREAPTELVDSRIASSLEVGVCIDVLWVSFHFSSG